ncbi:hypothetical protein WG66_003704, partial [Moniliophthora roreri]
MHGQQTIEWIMRNGVRRTRTMRQEEVLIPDNGTVDYGRIPQKPRSRGLRERFPEGKNAIASPKVEIEDLGIGINFPVLWNNFYTPFGSIGEDFFPGFKDLTAGRPLHSWFDFTGINYATLRFWTNHIEPFFGYATGGKISSLPKPASGWSRNDRVQRGSWGPFQKLRLWPRIVVWFPDVILEDKRVRRGLQQHKNIATHTSLRTLFHPSIFI